MSEAGYRLAEGERFYVGEDAIVIRKYPCPDARYMVFEGHIEPGGGPATLHTHQSSEFFYTLAGELAYFLQDRYGAVRVTTAETAFVPPGVVHTYRNLTTADAHYVAVVSPGTELAAFFNEVAVRPEAPRLDPAEVARIYRAHGIDTGLDPTTGPSAIG